MTPIDLASLKRKIRLLDLDDDCAADEVSKEELEALVAVVEAARDAETMVEHILLAFQYTHKRRAKINADDQSMATELEHMANQILERINAALHPFSHINGEQPC